MRLSPDTPQTTQTPLTEQAADRCRWAADRQSKRVHITFKNVLGSGDRVLSAHGWERRAQKLRQTVERGGDREESSKLLGTRKSRGDVCGWEQQEPGDWAHWQRRNESNGGGYRNQENNAAVRQSGWTAASDGRGWATDHDRHGRTRNTTHKCGGGGCEDGGEECLSVASKLRIGARACPRPTAKDC